MTNTQSRSPHKYVDYFERNLAQSHGEMDWQSEYLETSGCCLKACEFFLSSDSDQHGETDDFS